MTKWKEDLEIAEILYAKGHTSTQKGITEIVHRGETKQIAFEDYREYIKDLEDEAAYVNDKTVGESKMLELAEKFLKEVMENPKSSKDRKADAERNFEDKKANLEIAKERWGKSFKKGVLVKKMSDGTYSKQVELEILVKWEEEELEKWKWSLERNLRDPKSGEGAQTFLREMVENRERLLQEAKDNLEDYLETAERK